MSNSKNFTTNRSGGDPPPLPLPTLTPAPLTNITNSGLLSAQSAATNPTTTTAANTLSVASALPSKSSIQRQASVNHMDIVVSSSNSQTAPLANEAASMPANTQSEPDNPATTTINNNLYQVLYDYKV